MCFLHDHRPWPTSRRGDVIVVFATGAYNARMAPPLQPHPSRRPCWCGGRGRAVARPGSSRTNCSRQRPLTGRFSPVPEQRPNEQDPVVGCCWVCGHSAWFRPSVRLLPSSGPAGEGAGAAHLWLLRGWLFFWSALVWVVHALCQPAPHTRLLEAVVLGLQPGAWPSSGRGELTALDGAARPLAGWVCLLGSQRADAGLSVGFALLTEAAGTPFPQNAAVALIFWISAVICVLRIFSIPASSSDALLSVDCCSTCFAADTPFARRGRAGQGQPHPLGGVIFPVAPGDCPLWHPPPGGDGHTPSALTAGLWHRHLAKRPAPWVAGRQGDWTTESPQQRLAVICFTKPWAMPSFRKPLANQANGSWCPSPPGVAWTQDTPESRA